MDCYILAGGSANRMFPFNVVMEKSLYPINGKPVIRHIVDNLRRCPFVRKISIGVLDKFLPNFQHEFRDTNIIIKSFPNPVGTAKTVIDVMELDDDPLLIHYADCMTNIDYTDFIKKYSMYNNDMQIDVGSVIAITNTVKHDYSEVRVSSTDDKYGIDDVEMFNEKPQLPTHTWSGIAIINKKIFKDIWDNLGGDRGDYKDIATDIFPEMIKHKLLKSYQYSGYWYDMGNLNSYMKVVKLFEK